MSLRSGLPIAICYVAPSVLFAHVPIPFTIRNQIIKEILTAKKSDVIIHLIVSVFVVL